MRYVKVALLRSSAARLFAYILYSGGARTANQFGEFGLARTPDNTYTPASMYATVNFTLINCIHRSFTSSDKSNTMNQQNPYFLPTPEAPKNLSAVRALLLPATAAGCLHACSSHASAMGDDY